MSVIAQRLKELKIELPKPAKPVANYVPWVKTGHLVFVAGQIPIREGKPVLIGKVGQNVAKEAGADAARLCAINLVAQLADAVGGDLERVNRIVKIVGFVNAAPDFTDVSQVMNGASDLLVEIFGDKGKHARSSVGVAALPLGVPVEIELIAEVA